MKPFLCFLTCFLPLSISAQNIQGIVEGNNKFAFKLFNELKNSNSQNLFYSPFSISTALAMTYAGARGETALQMSRTLDFPSGGKFHSDYKYLMEKLKQGSGGSITLDIANGLWAQKDFKFLDSYFELVTSNYSSKLNNVDFKDEMERETTRKSINTWVEQITRDKIKNLISPADLDSQTRLVLVNAIYFYGDWANAFEKQETRPRDFFLSGQVPVNVPFMNERGRYNYFEDTEIQAIEIPYKDNTASMVIFLPNKKEGMDEFEKSFGYKYYADVITAFQSTDVSLSLPKFKTTYKILLAGTLAKMGMPLAFSKDDADFSGMTGNDTLYISEVIHQAFINVDEKGTEAAAATAVIMEAKIANPFPQMKFFNADHPFIFLIKDNSTGSILFMGKIMNPGG
ncbi:MAG: serpin family protein [Bacteroidetes bacterium]|nr:serpin family protein [Bacteroidota bacterium]